MQRCWKYIISLIIGVCLVLGIPISKSWANDDFKDKKVIVFIVDEVSLNEINNSNTPNMDLLAKDGSIGFMNTRAKSRTTNKGSSYLSLGMGVRTLASIQGGLAFERNEIYPLSDYNLVSEQVAAKDLYKLYTGNNPPDGEIINIAIGNIENIALNTTPNNHVGFLGKTARDNGILIGAIGNSDLDKPSREFTMSAMDENGVIPYGAVGTDLLIGDTEVLGGIKLNQEAVLEEVDRILPKVDLLFIDHGDTVRIEKASGINLDSVKKEQKQKAIERADSFLGQVMGKVDMEKTLFLVITPNPSKEMINEGNFALTPIIVLGNNLEKGLLTSKTTRREGLITNFDFAPTVLNFLGVNDYKTFIGEPMEELTNENPMKILIETEEQSLYLRKYRKVFHWAFIILVGMFLLGIYLSIFFKKKIPTSIINYFGLTTIAIPLTMMTVSIFGYKSIVFDLIYVILGGFLIAYILNKIFKNNLKTMMTIGFLTSALILIDVFLSKNLMIVSPLGSDAIAGGRFYGVGNDYMGILLGSTLLGFFPLFHLYNIKKTTMVPSIILYMILLIVGLSPFYGANIGGTLSAILTTIVILLMIFEKKLSFKTMAMIITGVVLSGIVLGVLDVLFNPNPTHAGKAIEALLNGGLDKFFDIIGSKLSQVVWNLANASWNIILFLQVILIILLCKFKKEVLINIKDKYSNLFKGFMVTLLASIVIFLLNDTGTIAAALILIYLFIPLGMLINHIE